MNARVTASFALASLLAGAPAAAQHVVAGFPRVNQSDVTGPAVTSGDQLSFEPGTVQSVSCAAAWGIRTEARGIDSLLMRLGLTTPDSVALDAEAQRTVGLLLAGGRDSDQAGQRVLAALSPDSSQPPAAREAARKLVHSLSGLLDVVGRIDPADPGRGPSTRLYEAVGAWDDFVDASSPAFLPHPPEEFFAILAVLARLDRAAIEHSYRDGDTGQVDAFGLECAPPIIAEPIVEVAFEVCVLSEGDFRPVPGVFLPASGDSLVGPDRRPLSEAHPHNRGYAIGAPWFSRDHPITFQGHEYRQWGMSRVVRPGELQPAGDYLGIRVFVSPEDKRPPDVIYVPFRDRCEVQAYRRTVEYRRVRG